MPNSLLSHPFRLTASGQVATQPEGSDAYTRERIIFLILTKPGERPLQPDLGMQDPAYDGVQHGALIAQADKFLPDVNIIDVQARATGDSTADVYVEFETNQTT